MSFRNVLLLSLLLYMITVQTITPVGAFSTIATKSSTGQRQQQFSFPLYASSTGTPSSSKKAETAGVADLNQLERDLGPCQTGTAARRVLSTYFSDDNTCFLYDSIVIPPDASAKGMSDGDLAIMTRIRNTKYSIMELIDLNGDGDANRASIAVLTIFISSSVLALIANQNLVGLVPELLRFVVVFALVFAPLVFVGYGISTPDKLQAWLVQLQASLVPSYRKRMIQHEAGHFLMGHLLGWPIQTYQTANGNAVQNAVTFYPLSDPDVGRNRAQLLGFDVQKKQSRDNNNNDYDTQSSQSSPSYFSDKGRGSQLLQQQSVFRREEANKKNYTAFSKLQVDSINEPTTAWPYRGFDDATLDKLAVVSVAGVCAELLAFGNAQGGLADFNQLKQLFQSRANSEEGMSDREMENRIRYALGYTLSQLRGHLGALDALEEVMERGGTIAECVYAIETCSNISGDDKNNNNDIQLEEESYEIRRKAKFQQKQSNVVLAFLEKTFLGGEPKTADQQEDRNVQGKGGGYKQQQEPKFILTGDDPFYLAIGVAGLFLLWASNGGLTLH